MTYQKLKLETEGAIRIITLSDPATMNAASVEMAEELTDAFATASAQTPAVRAIVLTGEGRGFCSGANLSAGRIGARRAAAASATLGRRWRQVYNPLVTFAREMPTPLVTAVNGAGGRRRLLAGAAGRPDRGGRKRLLPAGVPAHRPGARRRLDLPAAAHDRPGAGDGDGDAGRTRLGRARRWTWGLINRCVPDAELMPTALALAGELANGPASLGLTRQLIWSSLDTGWTEQLHREAVAQTTAGRTQDFAEGVAAFLQKRKAEFKGQ